MDDDDVLAFVRGELRAIRPALREDMPALAEYKHDLKLDSLDLVELVARIEQRYELTIPDSDLPEFVSLAATARYIQLRTQA